MEYVVLGLLILQPMTLYQLNRAFQRGISMFYSASFGSLQAAARSLLGKGWVTCEAQVEGGRNKKIYTITEAGRQAFFAWMLAEIPASKLEVTALARVYFLGLVENRQQKRQIVQTILAGIDQAHDELNDLNAALAAAQVPPAYREVFHYQVKTLDYGLGTHRFARAWFAALLAELE